MIVLEALISVALAAAIVVTAHAVMEFAYR
jgi:hypothetical protein